jgi:hypothetical protein
MPRKKNPASRKVRERDGEREDRIEGIAINLGSIAINLGLVF